MTILRIMSVLLFGVGLAACGGGDDAAPPPAPPPVVVDEVPASATASTAAYGQFAGSLAASETAEPLALDKVVPPTSETDEPIDLT